MAGDVSSLLFRPRDHRFPILNDVTQILNGGDFEFLRDGNRIQIAPDRAQAVRFENGKSYMVGRAPEQRMCFDMQLLAKLFKFLK